MPETIKPAPMPRSFLTDMPTATMNAGLTLLSRRSTALADFWRSCAEVRQPAELMAVQLNYWTQLMDDYQEAFNEGVSQLSGAFPEGDSQQPSSAPMAHSA